MRAGTRPSHGRARGETAVARARAGLAGRARAARRRARGRHRFPGRRDARRGDGTCAASRRPRPIPRTLCARAGSKPRSRGSRSAGERTARHGRAASCGRACSSFQRAGSHPCCESSPACSPSGWRRARRHARALDTQARGGDPRPEPDPLCSCWSGSASPAYLDAYRTPGGTLVGAIGGLLIFGCYLLMLRLGRVPEPRRTGDWQ